MLTRRQTARLVLATGLCGCLLVALCAGYFWYWLNAEFKVDRHLPSSEVFEIEAGDTLSGVLSRFGDRYGMAHQSALTLVAKVAGMTNIKRGEYLLPETLTPLQLLQLFHEGRVLQRSLTLVEGHTAAEVLAQLRGEPYLRQTLEGKSEDDIARMLGIEHGGLEGWLFPDTYYFVKGSSEWSLLQRAHRRMREILDSEWQQRLHGLPYESPFEALIMASIVEKETALGEERQQIAGVFVRRLQRGMRLQTDPTVIYGLGEAFDGNLTRRHLRDKTPYNTYVIKGLPPTPIALPGRDSIHAALNPQPGDSLYFVSRGDGSHVFSRTLAEHQRAVDIFQKRRPRKDNTTLNPGG